MQKTRLVAVLSAALGLFPARPAVAEPPLLDFTEWPERRW